MLHKAALDTPVDADAGPPLAVAAAEAALPPPLDPSWRAGRKLAEARRQRGLTLEQVAERIRVRKEFLQALEQMNVKLLPGKAYALAFLRSYARELGIDQDAIVDQFQDECALTRESVQQIRGPASRPHPERPWLAAAALLVVAAGFVGWRALSQTDDAVIAETAPLGSGAAAGSPGPAASGAQRVVQIRAVSQAWLEARGPDGTVFLSQILQPGEVYQPDPSPGWTVHARDGAAFELFVNGQPAGLLGTAGMPVLGRSIDEITPVAAAPSGA